MTDARRTIKSEYIEWAKTRAIARFNLATSGVVNYPIGELGVTINDIELSGPSLYGYEPLQRALAAKCEVEPENVVASIGTSMANHLAMAAILEPGDEALIELPAYDPLLGVARYLGATVKRFTRRFDDGFTVHPSEIERAVTSRTRLIVMTNLHNPTSVLTDKTTLEQIGDVARSIGARVLVDEVYLETLFGRAQRSAFHLGQQFVTTGSLTKAYGLSGLRCGWVLAEPELARRMWRLNDLFGNIPAHPAERLSFVALAKLDRIASRAQALIEANRVVLNRFLDSRDDLDTIRPEAGTTVAPRLKGGDVDDLCLLLREKYETVVVPGSFFEMPEHFRIGIGCDPAMLAEGLPRLAAALDEMKS
ncbi:MAG TPA: aminotransferase class I/II-fold pyridoxal phosphate-dependent enzyme [Blastocatellia bacterium]|nr:aminotransferase class I/II-fold pyridoxal phosphate-dependent enzyme [Blastocatellia bacterium]